MKIKELFHPGKPLISFEFFPPKTAKGLANLKKAIASLKALAPSFVSMTYGAGGSTRQKTVQLVSYIKHEAGLEAMAHLTCVGHNQAEILSILTELKEAGIQNVMALRGDPPGGQMTFQLVEGGFQHAVELVRFIRSHFDFCLGVAGYPEKHVEALSAEEDLRHLKEKVEAGADFIITQLFFDNADYFSFCGKLKKGGISVPVVAGIMPIKDVDQIQRFTSMCGAKIPRGLLNKLNAAKGNQEKVIQIGIDHAVSQCEELIKKKVPGIHFYTLNNSRSTREVFERLRKM